MIDRDTLLSLLQAARAARRPDYARSLAADWLARWPNDLEVQFVMAQVEVEQGDSGSAARRLRQVIAADPENIEAYDLLAVAARTAGDPLRATLASSSGRALRKEVGDDNAPAWLRHLTVAQKHLESGNAKGAVDEAKEALQSDPDVPLPALVLMRSLQASGDSAAAVATARAAYDRWPECVAFSLTLADDLLRRGEHARAVEYLHRAASNDPTGHVALKVLGRDNPYRSLWSEKLTADISRPVPAEVAAILGDNRLAGAGSAPRPDQPEATTAAAATTLAATETVPAASAGIAAPIAAAIALGSNDGPAPEPQPWESFRGPDTGDQDPREAPEIERIRADFDRMAARLRTPEATTDVDRRQPAYIVMSSRTRMVQTFGEDRFARVDEAIHALVDAMRTREGWSAYVFYPDDPTTLKPFRLTPVDPANAWQLKLRLADLDRALARR
jgi:tetratricopeptide (TPR) repeat protein